MKRMKLQTGSNLVEFAIVLPLLLTLVFGIIDFSLALYDKAVITNAAREGARAGVVFRSPQPTNDQIAVTAATNYCSTYLITFADVQPLDSRYLDLDLTQTATDSAIAATRLRSWSIILTVS